MIEPINTPLDTQLPINPPQDIQLTQTPLTTSRRSPLVPVLVSICVLALGAAGYFGYQNYQLNKQVIKVPPSPTSSPKSAKSAEKEDSTANWKTYTNTTLNYSIKFPSTFTTQVMAAGAGIQEARPTDGNIYIYQQDSSESYLDRIINIEVFQEKPTYSMGTTSTTKINGVDAIKVIIPNSKFDIYLISTPSKEYIEIYVTNDPKRQSLANQILSTFKLSNPTSLVTSKDTIYTSKEVSDDFSPFTLSYPPSWTLKEEYSQEDSKSLIVTLTNNNNSSIKIVQGAGGGGRCLYPDELDYNTFDGMGYKIPNYIQLNKPAQWRIDSNSIEADVCQHKGSEYKNITEIGWITIKANNQATRAEIQSILEKIQFKPSSSTKTMFD